MNSTSTKARPTAAYLATPTSPISADGPIILLSDCAPALGGQRAGHRRLRQPGIQRTRLADLHPRLPQQRERRSSTETFSSGVLAGGFASEFARHHARPPAPAHPRPGPRRRQRPDRHRRLGHDQHRHPSTSTKTTGTPASPRPRPSPSITSPSIWALMQVVDFDGDGLPVDLFVPQREAGRGRDPGRRSTSTRATTSSATRARCSPPPSWARSSPRAADINGDGKLRRGLHRLAPGFNQSRLVEVFLDTGQVVRPAGGLARLRPDDQPQLPFQVPKDPLLDYNGDGRADILGLLQQRADRRRVGGVHHLWRAPPTGTSSRLDPDGGLRRERHGRRDPRPWGTSTATA